MRIATAVALILASTAALPADASSFDLQQPSGRYAAGFDVVKQHDNTRSSEAGDKSLPVQTLVWYPARKGTGRMVSWGDYVKLGAGQQDTAAASTGTSPRSVMDALRDATAYGGRYPVVVYAPDASSPAWENSDLCEYLASHGFVVIAAPGVAADAEARARDIAFLIGYAGRRADTDLSRIAVIGSSAGGPAGVVAAAQDERIDALVTLDGKTQATVEGLAIPVLAFVGRDAAPVNVSSTAKPAADLITVAMPATGDAEFKSAAQRSGQASGEAYEWVARYTLAFLDTYLKGDPKEQLFLEGAPASNGVPAQLMTVQMHRGAAPSSTVVSPKKRSAGAPM